MARVKSYSEARGRGAGLQSLIELGAQGVAIEDSMDYVGNVDRFGEIFPEVEQQEDIVVTAYYPDTVDVAVVGSGFAGSLSRIDRLYGSG